jgi:hypothetical protein
MSAGKGQGGKPEGERGADGTAGSSGEGAGSALEAMLRKRQMRVDPQPDSAGPPVTQNQDGKAAKE